MTELALREQSAWRLLAVALLFAAGISILSAVIMTTDNAGNKDYVSYWAAGQLLSQHHNPYDTEAALELEKGAGFRESKPLMMRNAPWALVLALPLGLAPVKLGAILWSITLVGTVMASVRLLSSIYRQGLDQTHLFGYLFAPVLACLTLGQTSAFALFGLVLFLRLHPTRPVAAGVGLALVSIKPHLVIPILPVLLIWIARKRAYSIAIGCLAALAGAVAVLLVFDNAFWEHYAPVLRDAATESQVIPTFSSVLRLAISPDWSWLQFAPAAVACVWGIWYFLGRRQRWDWNAHGPLLLLVSVWSAPTSWFTDEIILMPAILQALYLDGPRQRALISFALIDGIAVLGTLAGMTVGSGFYIWTTTAWLAWYTCCRWKDLGAASHARN